MARTTQTVRAVSSHSLSPKTKTKTKTKTSSNQRDLEDKFARMRLDPSSEGNKPPSSKLANKKKTRLKSQQGGRRNTPFKEYEHGYAPVVPPLLYDFLQEAVGYIQHLETHKDDMYAQKCLEAVEMCIQDEAIYYRDYMPRDWKYERATAGKWQPIPYFSYSSLTA